MENVSDTPTRVVVIDDDIVVSEIMALSISKERGLSLVGVAHTDRDAAKVVRREQPDVVLFNYRKADNRVRQHRSRRGRQVASLAGRLGLGRAKP